MSPFELVGLALSRLRSGRVRAALTMLGVVIGVASVVALVGVGQGTTSNITDRLAGLGTNLLTVNAGSSRAGTAGSATTLTLGDAEAIAGLAGVAGVAPEVSTSATVTAEDESTTTTILGTTPDYPQVRAFNVQAGSFLTTASLEHELRVAVLGASTAEDLGLSDADLGSEIRVAGLPFTLIGILQAKGGTGFQDPDDQVLVPVTVAQAQWAGSDSVRSIGVSVSDPAETALRTATVTALLRQRHNLATADSADFTIVDQAQLLETATSISGTLTFLLGGIASISLVVGGIGIMNIMLVSVRERTREIGIRKAIGARGRDILAQFLVEALTISMIGGLVGIAIGVGASAIIARVAGWSVVVTPITLVAAVGFSLAVGVLFGVWPARQAARLDPIEALRYE